MKPVSSDSKSELVATQDSGSGHQSAVESRLTLEDLRSSNHPALERIAKRAAENMRSSSYSSHNSHHSAHN
jgi:hypothetical protein